MGIDLTNLSAQGRAYSAARPWEAEELEAVILLQNERGLNRITAADYVRNGIMTLEDFDKASKGKFKPKTIEQAHNEAEEELSGRVRKLLRKPLKKRLKKNNYD